MPAAIKMLLRTTKPRTTGLLAPLPKVTDHPHPNLKGWNIAWLPLLSLVEALQIQRRVTLVGTILNSQGHIGQSMLASAVEEIITSDVPAQTLVGLDFSGIASMDKKLWEELGPQLARRVLKDELGQSRRLLYMVGENSWLANDLQWGFEQSARATNSENLAVLAPGTGQGFCGELAPVYAEALALVNRSGSLSSLELYQHLQRRYRLAPAHADQCLAFLSQLGLLYRHSASFNSGRSSICYDLNARGYALSLPEKTIRDKGFKLI